MKQVTVTGAWALKQRHQRKLNQKNFWTPLGITQSGGSRYESGRNIPKPVAKLLIIAYGTDKEAGKTLDEVCKNALSASAGNGRQPTKEANMATKKPTKPAAPAKKAPGKTKKGC